MKLPESLHSSLGPLVLVAGGTEMILPLGRSCSGCALSLGFLVCPELSQLKYFWLAGVFK